MSKSKGFVAFIFGAAVGSAVTWLYVKNKYEQIAQEEIDSVKEVFSKREPIQGKCGVGERRAHMMDKPDMAEFVTKIKENGYTNYTDVIEEKESKTETKKEKPYVIAPEEFGEEDEYDTISLTYYSDRVLADDDDKIVEDVEDVVGFGSLESFGEYEDDSVYVRNDRLKCDYEILLDQRRYSDVINKKPHQMED